MKPARPLLAPLAPLYSLAVSWRELRLERGWEPVRRLARPVVSIGNLSAGGAGKTPLAIALARALAQRGVAVDVLSRGYGRSSKQATRVDPEGAATEFGDEPLLISRSTGLPVYVARQRYDAGQMAEAEEPQSAIHLLDDGFQHRQLHRDIDIVLVSETDLDDCLLPTGNLREPLQALRRASILAIPADEDATEGRLRALGLTAPLWRIRRTMKIPALNCPVVAFCGIARPHQFFSGLEEAGLQLAARKAFADHHRYTMSDLLRLSEAAFAARALLLTTEKDATRIGSLRRQMPVPLLAVGLISEILDQDAALDALLNRLQA